MKNNCKECYEENKTPNIDDCNYCKMSKKYVITNCPAYLKYNKCFHNGHCDNITDCLLKRIVDECKWETNIDIECRGDLAERILSELEIEEA